MPAGRRRRPLRRFGALVAVAALVAVCGGGVAWGDSPSAGPAGVGDLAAQFGGYSLSSHAEGLTITYTSPGLIPGTPDQLAALDIPEALTNMSNGPSGYALASLGYPGSLLANLPSALSLMGIPGAENIPSWPLRAEAFFPAGPASLSRNVGPGTQLVNTSATTSTATASFGSVGLSALLSVGAITSSSQSQVLDGQVVSRSRVQISGLDLLSGLIHIGSVTTDLVATSNGQTSATSGHTTLGDVTLLGVPATIDASGLHLGAPPASPAGTTTTANPILGPLLSAFGPVISGLNGLLQSTLGSATAGLNSLLNQAGITIRTLPATETRDGADASRFAGGLSIELHYDGKTEPVLSQLLDLIPVQDLPSQGLGPIPFTSPQAIVGLLRATHIVDVGLAAANVHVVAAPPFTFPTIPDAPVDTVGGDAVGGVSDAATTPPPAGLSGAGAVGTSFSTPAPELPTAPRTSGREALGAARPASFLGATPLAAAAGILLALLVAIVFGFGTRRFADGVLAAGAASCPDGLDRPPDPRSPT